MKAVNDLEITVGRPLTRAEPCYSVDFLLSCATKNRFSRIGFGALLALLTCFPAVAHAQAAAATADDDNPAIEKITSLNKKALDAYNDLEFEQSRKILKQALDLCTSAGLDAHPVAARTHIHMGVVLIAAKQQDLGLKQFRKAIEIQPDIQVTKALANPEILQAFKEAGASVEPPAGEGAQGGPTGTAPTPVAPEQLKGMQHRAAGRSAKGKAIPIVVAIGDDVRGYTKVLLEYRPEGVAEFQEVEMKKAGNRYSAEIPASATQGSLVSYYIEADPDNDDADAIATSGTEDHPYNVSLVAGSSGGEGRSGCVGVDCEDEEEAGPRIFLGLMGGTGFGFVSGNGEINDRTKASGFAAAGAAQIMPEVGYFLWPRLRLSLQLRYQILSATTPLNLDKYLTDAQKANPDNKKACGGDGLCSTQTGSAVAVLARATWFFGADLFRPYFSLALGGGYIRHEVTFASLGKVCGTMGTETCVDTVLAGPVFAGPGAGVLFAITPMFGVVADVTSLLGVPKFTYNFDLNVGVSVRL